MYGFWIRLWFFKQKDHFDNHKDKAYTGQNGIYIKKIYRKKKNIINVKATTRMTMYYVSQSKVLTYM